MQKDSLWRPIIILGVIAFCTFAMIQKGLKPGMDLAGGFVLTYEVTVPDGADAGHAVEQMIDVLSKRVDPTGVRNLVWRRQGASRLEIQAALAGKEVRGLRETYNTAYDALKAGNVSRFQLEQVLRMSKDLRQAELTKIGGGQADRDRLLANLAKAHDALEDARKPYESAVAEVAKAEENLNKLPVDAPVEQKTQMQTFLKERLTEMTEKTKALNDAKNKYEPMILGAMALNIDMIEVDRVLNLPDVEQAEKGGKKTNPRQEQLKRLLAEHPDRAKQIQAVVDAWNDYSAKRGGLDDPEDLIAMLRGSGVLEFRIAPDPAPEFFTYRDQLREKGPNIGKDKPYLWFPVDDINSFAESARSKEALREDPWGYFQSIGMVGDRYGDTYYLLLSNQPGQRLSAEEPHWRLDNAHATRDERGFPAVGFKLNTAGGQLLGAMTETYKSKDMAIVLDGRSISSARINSRIDTDGIITRGGGYSEKDLSYMVRTLNAGSLKATLADRPSSIKYFQAEAGADNLARGKEAFIIVSIIVALFLIVYYFFWGVVAVLTLIANIIIILGVMAALESTFTMAGIAGVVLTIGMAVDANVLIFERIREELQRGADIKTAVRLGFDKAMSAILDSNVTTLITCMILGYFATADVRGFAVTLGIGLVANVFTAVYCARWVIDVWVKMANPQKAPMLPMAAPAVQRLFTLTFDWMGKRKLFYTISGVVCVVGLAVFFGRGGDMLDIEFRSGTQVGFKLADGKILKLEDAREMLRKTAAARNMPELAPPVASLTPVGDMSASHEAKEFSVSVLNTDDKTVSDAVKEAFKDYLNTERAIRFKGADPAGAAASGPEAGKSTLQERLPDSVYIIRGENLNESIGRDTPEKVNDFVGGVAIVLDELTPPASVKDLEQRIKRQRQQPKWERLGNRDFRVIGLTAAPGASTGGEVAYSSVVIVASDRATNYAESPSQFSNDLNGLAGTEWRLVSEALLFDSSLDSISNFSAQVSDTMKRSATVALVLSMIAIALYIWIRFGSLSYGSAAIIALVHDVAVALGAVAMAGVVFAAVGPILGLSDFKINLTMIAAILTIVGYSINDKIVVFDRIRELRGRLATVSPQIINDAINQTISRTMLTGGTTLAALLILYFLGGEAVKGFAFALFIGIIAGTYSSIAIASPLLLLKKSTSAPDAEPAPTTTPKAA